MCPKVVDKQLKRNEIARSAARVLSRRGIHDFKMIDIACEAGIGKGTLYEYFRSKEEIIDGTYKLILQDYTEFLEERTTAVSGPEEKLKMFIRSSFEFFESNPDNLRLVFDFWAAGIDRHDSSFFLAGVEESYRDAVRQLRSFIDEGVAGRIFKPVDSEMTASLLLAVMDGLMFQVEMGLHRLDSRMLAEVVSRMVLEGITVK